MSHKHLGQMWKRVNTVYTPLSGVPRFPIPRSANSDSPLKHHDLYGKQQLRRRCRAPLNGNSPLNGTPLKGVYTVYPTTFNAWVSSQATLLCTALTWG